MNTSEVYPDAAEKAPLSPEERAQIRAQLMSHDAGNALRFQAKAIKKYGAAGGIMCRELLFWDGMGWDPEGFIYLTKEEGEERMGLSPKSQDGGRKRLEDAGVLEVDRRPRRNPEGKVTHPSLVLHYRLNLRELFEQMTPEGTTLNQKSKHADADAPARRSGSSRKRKGVSEHAVTGAPYAEETAEATAEGSSDLPPKPPKGDRNGRKRRRGLSTSYGRSTSYNSSLEGFDEDDESDAYGTSEGGSSQEQPDVRAALARFEETHGYVYDCCVEDGDYERLTRLLRDYRFGTYSEAAVKLAVRTPDGREEAAS